MGYQLSQFLSLRLFPEGCALPKLALTPNSAICGSHWGDDRIVPGQPRSFLTSTPLCLLSKKKKKKWHSRLGKPAWFHLRALAFSHAPISDSPKWLTVTTKLGTKLTESRHRGHLLMLGWQNQFRYKSEIVNVGVWIHLLWKKRRVTYMVMGFTHKLTESECHCSRHCGRNESSSGKNIEPRCIFAVMQHCMYKTPVSAAALSIP